MKYLRKAGVVLLFASLLLLSTLLFSSCANADGSCKHIFADADCYTPRTCILCGATDGEAAGHTGGIADCTHRAYCAVCGEEYGEIMPHIPEADDGDCMTAVSCTVCKNVLTEAKPAHTPVADDGDCTTFVYCVDCHTILVDAKAHTYTDDCDTVCNNEGCLFTRIVAHRYVNEVATDNYLKTPATCQNAAVYYKSCQCGKKGSETFTSGSPLPHSFREQVIDPIYLKSVATCTEKAAYYYSCACGAKGGEGNTFEYGDTLPHRYENELTDAKYLASAATCQSAALYYKSCQCGGIGTETFESGRPLPHAYTEEVASEAHLCTPATCTEKATYYYSCTCGAHDTEKSGSFAYGATLPHAFTEAVATDEHLASHASCTAKATYYYSCADCGANDTESEPFESGETLPHSPDTAKEENRVAPTCGVAGHYDEVVYCATCGHELSREEKEIPATGKHTAAEDDGDCETDIPCTVCGLVAVPGFSHKEAEAVHENILLPTCAENGSRDIVVYCAVCEKELNRENEVLLATGDHIGATPVEENRVAPTCGEAGSYQTVTYCGECGCEMLRNTHVIPATGNHTEGEAVEENREEPTCGADGSYDEVIYCTVCDAELSREEKSIPATGAHIYDKEVMNSRYEKSAATCTAYAVYYKSCYCGAFSVEDSETFLGDALLPHVYDREVATDTYKKEDATCTMQAVYYKSCYCGAFDVEKSPTFLAGELLPHIYDQEAANNDTLAKAATCTEQALYYKSCTCGAFDEEKSETFAYGALLPHVYDQEKATDDYLVEEATCTMQALYLKSCVCGATVDIAPSFRAGELKPHTPAPTITENDVPPTCGEAGHYDLVVYCATCASYEFSRVTYTVNPTGLHTEGEAVIENLVNATCKEKGSYDEVIYCTVCDTELSREGKELAATGLHVQSTTPEIENEVESSCTVKGSYDEVYHCTGCGEEMLRVTKEKELASHDTNDTVIKEATCLEKGEKKVACKDCDYEATVATNRLRSHTYEEGFCTVCGIPEKSAIVEVSGNTITGIDEAAVQKAGGIIRIPETASNGAYITSIADSAFAGRTDIKAIYISANITSIKNNAFDGCTNLETLVFAEGVSANLTIGNYAFRNCTALTAINLPDSTKSVGYQSFYNCTNVKKIVIGEGVTSIAGNAFAGCVNLETVIFNAVNCSNVGSNLQFSQYIFANGGKNVGGFDIEIGKKVTRIPAYLFYYNRTAPERLESLSMIKSITFPENGVCTEIGAGAFAAPYADNVVVYIPAYIKTVGEEAFRGSSISGGYQTVDDIRIYTNWPEAWAYFDFFHHEPVILLLEADSVPSGFAKSWCYSGMLPYGTSSSSSVSFPNPYVFSATGAHGVDENGYLWAEKKDGTLTLVGGDESLTALSLPTVIDGKTVNAVARAAFFCHINVTSVTIPETITEIGSAAFFYCPVETVSFEATACKDFDDCIFGYYSTNFPTTALTATIGKNVTHVPARLFRNQYLHTHMSKTITFESGSVCESIGRYAFAEDNGIQGSGLTSFTIPSSVISIGQNAFSNCESLFVTENNILYVDNWVIMCANTSISSVTLREGTVGIADYAFDGCGSLTSIFLPEGVRGIGKYAFNNARMLSAIGIPASVVLIDDQAFNVCYALESVTFAEGSRLERIGSQAFYNCSSLTSFTIPTSVTTLGNEAFWRCYDLTTIHIPASVTSIGLLPFRECNKLTAITVDANNPAFSSIDGNLYSKDGTVLVQYAPGKTDTSFTLPASVTTIKEGALLDCRALSLTIPSSVTVIEKIAISGGYLVIYAEAAEQPAGWENDWNSSSRPVVWDCKNNNVASDGSIYVVSNGLRFSIKDGEAAVEQQSTTISVSSIPASVTFDGVSYPVTKIVGYAFSSCKNLTSIELPSSLKTIEEYAFYACDNLTSVELPSSLKTIGKCAFYSCDNLKAVYIPASVETVGECLFQYCSKVTIYVEFAQSQKPSGWNSKWNASDTWSSNPTRYPVVWDYKNQTAE